MAYDEELAERVRGELAAEQGLSEQRMFGGLAFLIGGHLAVAASSQGGLMLRCDPEETQTLLGEAGASPMVMRGQETSGWLRVSADAVVDDDALRSWVARGTAYARSLPAN